jgi:hypothetical protein
VAAAVLLLCRISKLLELRELRLVGADLSSTQRVRRDAFAHIGLALSHLTKLELENCILSTLWQSEMVIGSLQHLAMRRCNLGCVQLELFCRRLSSPTSGAPNRVLDFEGNDRLSHSTLDTWLGWFRRERGRRVAQLVLPVGDDTCMRGECSDFNEQQRGRQHVRAGAHVVKKAST